MTLATGGAHSRYVTPLYVKGKTHGRPDEGPPVVMHDGFAGWDEAEEQEGPVVSKSPHLFVMTLPLKSTIVAHQGVGES